MDKRWIPPIIAADKAKKEELAIIFTEAKERLKETIDSAEKYYQRSIAIALLSITLLTSSLAFLSSKIPAFKLTTINLMVVATSTILAIVLVRLRDSIKLRRIYVAGADPKEIFIDDFFINLPENCTPEKMLYHNLIRNYQSRIDDNVKAIKKRADRIDESLNWLYLIPLAAITIILLGAVFHLPFFM